MTTSDDPAMADLTLERHRLGELPAAEAARLERAAAADPRIRARLDALAASDADIRAHYGDDGLAQAVTARLRHDRGRPRGRLFIGLSGTAAAIVLAATLLPGRIWRIHPAPGEAPHSTGAEAIRVKGEAASLLVYRSAATGSEPLRDGDAARRGDLLRLAYRASAPRFGVIVSIDGRGVVTRHFPVVGDAAIALQPGDVTPLADAYELDDAPRWERFFLITNAHAFHLGPVLDAARGAAARAGAEPPAALPLPSDFEQTSLLLRKVS